jgi:ABC-2 type transport system ATP-binding protein
MADVQALCRRVVVIHRGRLLFDGELAALVERFTAHKTIAVRLADPDTDLSSYGEVVASEDGLTTLRVPKKETAHITERLLADLAVVDLTVEDPPIEEVIELVFAQGAP